MKSVTCLLVASVFVFLCTFDVTIACSCVEQSLVEQYCTSDWVFSVKVIDAGTVSGWEKAYTVEVLKANRFQERLKPSEIPTHVVTFYDPVDSCTLSLINERYYILSGRLESSADGSNRLRIFNCQLFRIFNTEQELKKFKLPRCPNRK